MNYFRKILRYLFRIIAFKDLNKIPQHVYIGGYTRFSKNTYLSNYCSFNGCIVYGKGKVEINSFFHSGHGLKIITVNHNYEGSMLPYGNESEDIHKNVKINENVWVGNDVIILGGVEIGEGSIIQAGSVVVKSIPPFSIAGGHPCIPFKKRDINHYNKLKKQGKQIDLY